MARLQRCDCRSSYHRHRQVNPGPDLRRNSDDGSLRTSSRPLSRSSHCAHRARQPTRNRDERVSQRTDHLVSANGLTVAAPTVASSDVGALGSGCWKLRPSVERVSTGGPGYCGSSRRRANAISKPISTNKKTTPRAMAIEIKMTTATERWPANCVTERQRRETL